MSTQFILGLMGASWGLGLVTGGLLMAIYVHRKGMLS